MNANEVKPGMRVKCWHPEKKLNGKVGTVDCLAGKGYASLAWLVVMDFERGDDKTWVVHPSEMTLAKATA